MGQERPKGSRKQKNFDLRSVIFATFMTALRLSHYEKNRSWLIDSICLLEL
jgi:hypothetical protein